MKKQISDLQLSHQTVARRVECLFKDTFELIISDSKTASRFNFSLDESCDITDIQQLLIWIRYDVKYGFKEKLLTLTSLKTTSKGADIYSGLKECLLKNEIDIKKLVSVTTDGAPAMVGKNWINWIAQSR